jgi:hypothetical protein
MTGPKLGQIPTATAHNIALLLVQFWIADAPHHVGREAAVVSALHDAVAKCVHIYPVAASGIDDP